MAEQLDVLIFGGGVAGLWTLHRLRAAGLRALLLESHSLGRGQTIQSQGIIHGGGKYALRGVRDFAAVRSIRDMPARWREHLRGVASPDLQSARVLSDNCLLWLPRTSFLARLQGAGFMRVVEQAGLLATRPRSMARDRWPTALRGSAAGVYEMAEPVVHTGSLLKALARGCAPDLRQYVPLSPRALVEVTLRGPATPGGDVPGTRAEANAPEWAGVLVRPAGGDAAVTLAPRAVVLAAGEGNAELLRCGGATDDGMQRRPLRMVLLRGQLPSLFGHCVAGGKTRLTVTSAEFGDEMVWQVGGELAERMADEADLDRVHAQAAAELRRFLPGLDLRHARMASYRAVRAEARDAGRKRPSGVHVARVAANAVVAWPTKLALAPLLADEVCAEVFGILGVRAGNAPLGAESPPADPAPGASPWERWPAPAVATPPWEEATWTPVPSAIPA